MRFLPTLLALAVALASFGIYQGAFAYFKGQQLASAEARLSLYRNSLETEIRHFGHLPFLLSNDPVVSATLAGAPADALDYRLARFSQSAGLDAIYLMDHTGLTISASNARSPASFKGQNYGFRPYFQAAQRGELGEFYGIGATTGLPGYFYAIAVRHPDNQDNGVIAIKADLSGLQDSWQASGDRIFLANGDGVVILASDPDWRYRTMSDLSDSQRTAIAASRQFSDEPLTALDWTAEDARREARINDDTFFYVRTGNLPNSWSLHFFLDQGPAKTSAWLATGVFFVLVLIGLIITQMGRARQIGAALARSEREELLLRQANEKLAVEIEERRQAERNLQKTEAELAQASRLAALGQLASSVTHELGQPIAAMRNQLAAAEMTQGATTLNEKMQGLVARMEDITKQLRFFSRKGRDQFETLDFREIVAASLDLMNPNITLIGADVRVGRPAEPLLLNGNRMRLEQVITNILRNALDAIEDAPQKRVSIHMGQEAETIWCSVEDTGHGLGDKTFDDLGEPFATTKESGRGMGLGLTISAGIVSDHGGTIGAENRPEGGAVFRVALPATPSKGTT